MKKSLVIAAIFLNFSSMLSAQELSVVQKHGACAGYHQYWAMLSMRSQAYSDQRFSENVVDQLDARFGSQGEYSALKSRALLLLTQALRENNPNMVRSFAGFCVELKLPIGRNTK
jgi:hypothetical protein